MSSEHVEYALNSAAWFLAGVVTTAIYWRWFGRRVARRGGAMKEPPLAVFTAIMVGLVSLASFFFGEASRLQLASYITCQAKVNLQFLQGYKDRVNINTQDRAVLDELFKRIGGHLESKNVVSAVNQDIGSYLAIRAENDEARAQHPITVTGSCGKVPTAGS